jgi:endonuclease/exonuclease/phosphatase family metal-dependent hydrolase
MPTMKIATWNVERPRRKSGKNATIIEVLRGIDADILILTETNSAIHPSGYRFYSPTNSLVGHGSEKSGPYYDGENRATVWSRYPATRTYETYDPFSSICVGLETPLGELIVYGTVIGCYGRGGPEFEKDIKEQTADWRRLSAAGNLCIAGDFNTAFANSPYFTKEGRQQLIDCFDDLNLNLLTGKESEIVDHVAISQSFLDFGALKPVVGSSSKDKRLSDHVAVWVTLHSSC